MLHQYPYKNMVLLDKLTSVFHLYWACRYRFKGAGNETVFIAQIAHETAGMGDSSCDAGRQQSQRDLPAP